MSQIPGTRESSGDGGASQEMTSEACAWGGVVWAWPGRQRGQEGGGWGRGREDLGGASGPGAGSGPLPGGVSCLVHPPRLSPPPLRAAPCMVSLPLSPRPLPPSLFAASLPGWLEAARDRDAESADPAPRRPPRSVVHAPARGEARGAARGRPPGGAGGAEGSRAARGSSAGSAPRNPAPHRPQLGLAMAAPRPPPAISVSVSAPAFYAPQKKFGPVVAPKPKVNPFRPGDSEAPSAAGAQRAQMGRVGEIPPPPPEGMRLGLGGTRAGAGLGAVVSGIWGCLERLQQRGLGAATLSRADVLTSSWSSWRGARAPGTVPSPPPGGGRRGCGARIFPSGSVFRSVTGANTAPWPSPRPFVTPCSQGVLHPPFLPKRSGTPEKVLG